MQNGASRTPWASLDSIGVAMGLHSVRENSVQDRGRENLSSVSIETEFVGVMFLPVFASAK